MNMDQNMNTNI